MGGPECSQAGVVEGSVATYLVKGFYDILGEFVAACAFSSPSRPHRPVCTEWVWGCLKFRFAAIERAIYLRFGCSNFITVADDGTVVAAR